MRIHFLGATRQVTGSRYLLEAGGLRLLVDCGLFQERAYQERNWESSPVPPKTIDGVLLTHAHLDHSGLIPRLVHQGFNKKILTTAATRDLAEIILEDSAHIQEEDAAFKAKRHRREKRKGRHPEKPLYTAQDVKPAMRLFKSAPYNEPQRLNEHVSVTFRDAGHILGSALLEIQASENGHDRRIVFSGDIGQWDKPIIRDPSVIEQADYVVMESTYGARNHIDAGSHEDQLCEVINATVEAGGNIIIPTFAVERAQELMFHIGRLVHQDRIPHLMVFLDSPMAVDVTEVFRRHGKCMDDEARALLEAGEPPLRFPGLKLVHTSHESKAINRIKGSCIIMAGSGMCTAGRIKHHLVKNISRPESTIVFVGYQANGTLGRQIVSGKPAVRIHGAEHPVRARVAQLHGFSAHADQDGLMRWVGHLQSPPRRIFLTHGEEEAADALAARIHDEHGWPVDVPEYQAEFELE